MGTIVGIMVDPHSNLILDLREIIDRSPGPPPLDIRQSLRGPEPSAAGPFGETDISRPVQCFKCREWGHPKQLCP